MSDKQLPRGATLVPPRREPLTRKLKFRVRIPAQVWLGLVIALLFVGAGALVRQAYHTWPVKDVVVIGRLNVLSAEEIARQILWVRNESFFTLDVTRVQRQVAAMPLVSRVAVRKRWPDSVELLLYEELPVALWNDEQLLTATGRLSDIPPGFTTTGLMRLYGADPVKNESVKYFRRLQQALNDRGLTVNSMSVNAVQAVDATLSNGWVVRFGRKYFEERLQRLVALLGKLDANEVRQVDLRYGKGAAIRWQTTGVTG
tara:strand:- start:839 stop:1612 length:774 start_codon:yes stop_codon:yes gene_type:complete